MNSEKVHTIEKGTKWLGFVGVKLVELFHTGLEKKIPVSSRTQVLLNFFSLIQNPFAIRFIPVSKDELLVTLLTRVEGDTENQVVEDGEKLGEALATNLAIHFPQYNFYPLTIKELKQIFSLEIGDTVEIARQETLLDVASLTISSPIGFQTRVGTSREEEKMAFWYTFPFISTQDSLWSLCETLLSHPTPCFLNFFVKPIELSEKEKEVLEHVIRTCESFTHSANVGILKSRAEILKDRFLSEKHLLESVKNAFVININLVAEDKIGLELINALGSNLTRPVSFGREKNQYLAGGFDWFRQDPEKTKQVFTMLEENTEYKSKREEAPRLRYVFDMQSASEILLLPIAVKETFPGIAVNKSKPLKMPLGLPEEGVVLGVGQSNRGKYPIRVKLDDHRRHVYAVGKTGTGKTSLLLKMALANIRKGDGVGVIDPHGDLIQLIVRRIPEDRIEDVILLDPGDMEYPIGLNLLECETDEQRAYVVDEMIAMLRLLYSPEFIGPIFEHNTRYGMLLLMSDTENPGTLVEFPYLFSNPDFHKKWLPKVTDPLVKKFWIDELPRITEFHKSEVHQYIVSKFNPFIQPPLMRNIIGQSRSGINFDQIINEGKVLLVNLAKGRLGELNAGLLGTIIIAKLYSAAMKRVNIPISRRRDFYLYVDEFQNLATETFGNILSEARKFRLSLTLCNQYVAQLPKKIVDAILGNVGTIIVFRVGIEDASLLESYFVPTVKKEALNNQANYHAYVRLLVDGILTTPFSMWTVLEPEEADAENKYDRIVQQSRNHGRKREEVEKEIAERLGFI